MKKTIVIFSNPFGYGPTGISIAILKKLIGRSKADIVFAGSGLCQEIIKDLPIKKILLDERKEPSIEGLLLAVKNPFVIGVQNRFCINVAKKLSLPSAYVDVLAWFWQEIPPDHLIADNIFWINFPGIEPKILKENRSNIHLVSGIVNPVCQQQNRRRRKKLLIINIGGAKYPVSNGIATDYLKLICEGINSLAPNQIYQNIIFTGGEDALKYAKKLITNKMANTQSLPNDEFIHELSRSSHLVTTAGMSSTLEAFSLRTPTSFLLPLNLSQMALSDTLKGLGHTSNCLEWANYIKIDNSIRNMSEKDAIDNICKYSHEVIEDKIIKEKFVEDFIKICSQPPEIERQSKFIDELGYSGASEIVDILSAKQLI